MLPRSAPAVLNRAVLEGLVQVALTPTPKNFAQHLGALARMKNLFRALSICSAVPKKSAARNAKPWPQP